jgi:hypothetical protein
MPETGPDAADSRSDGLYGESKGDAVRRWWQVKNAAAVNEQLAALVDEAGLSLRDLAREVNKTARRRGLRTRYDQTSAHYWIHGRRPQDPDLLTAVLSDKLGRVITVEQAGLGERAPRPSLAGSELVFAPASALDAETAIKEVEKHMEQLNRRAMIRGAVAATFTAAGLEALLGWQGSVARAAGDGAQLHVGTADVHALAATSKHLMSLDGRCGGGAVRQAAESHLRYVALPLLHGSYSDATGRALFAAVAYLHNILGWTACDEADYEAAGTHLRTAIRLARIAEDAPVLATAVTDLASVARWAGHPREALRLAEAAREPGARQLPAAMLARAACQEAMAAAEMGDAATARRAMSTAESALDAGRPEREPDGHALAGWWDDPQLQSELVYAEADLGNTAGVLRRAAQVPQTSAFARRNAVIAAVTARAHFQDGDDAQGLARAETALAAAGPLSSTRTLTHLKKLQPHLQRIAAPAAADLHRRIAALPA